jgi:hypothetical protein
LAAIVVVFCIVHFLFEQVVDQASAGVSSTCRGRFVLCLRKSGRVFGIGYPDSSMQLAMSGSSGRKLMIYCGTIPLPRPVGDLNLRRNHTILSTFKMWICR